MFQRLSSLLFGEVEEVAAELKGPNPCVTEADEEGWMMVNLPVETDCTKPPVEGGTEVPLTAQSLTQNNQSVQQPETPSRTEHSGPAPPPPHKRRRTHKTQARVSVTSPEHLSRPGDSPLSSGVVTPVTVPRRARLFTSTPSVSSGSGSECSGSRGSSWAGSERGCMDESWFVTPPPCFTAEGATAETSPMEDLLIEHPSMSVYVSPSSASMISASNLSVVGEESITSLAGSISRVTEPVAPASRGTMPSRVTRGAGTQVGALAKVTQVARVQRAKARTERRHLGRNRIQRQNRTREQVPRHGAYARTAMHQPSKRNLCH